jgi:drug/metabolite transporter (DMT)-like permease
LKPVVQLVCGIALIAGGYSLHQRKKIGVFIGLGAMVISAAFAVLESSAMSSVYESLDYPAAAASIGMGFTLFCIGICGFIIAIPLMSNTSNLE